MTLRNYEEEYNEPQVVVTEGRTRKRKKQEVTKDEDDEKSE